MPVIVARESPASSDTNLGLIIALIVGAVLLILIIVALLIPIFRQRRAARLRPPPSTLEEFMDKAERERIRDKAYAAQQHRYSTSSQSIGVGVGTPLLNNAPKFMPAGRHSRVPSQLPPPLPANVGQDYVDSDDDEPTPRLHTAGARTRPLPPGLQVIIPKTAPSTKSKWLEHSVSAPQVDPALISPSSGETSDSESLYSQRSAAASASARMHTIDLSSPPPPVPALPGSLRLPPAPADTPPSPASLRLPPAPADTPPSPALASPWPRLPLPEEEQPLARGNTLVVAGLLKKRAAGKRAAQPHRAKTRTEHIERIGSIRGIPLDDTEEEDEYEGEKLRTEKPLPALYALSLNSAEGDDARYYATTAQPRGNSRTPADDDSDTISVSSDETISQRPRPTRSAF